jgi:hypothetical protein
LFRRLLVPSVYLLNVSPRNDPGAGGLKGRVIERVNPPPIFLGGYAKQGPIILLMRKIPLAADPLPLSGPKSP